MLASSNAAANSSGLGFTWLAPFAKTNNVSFVLVSPSMLMRLKLRFAACFSAIRSTRAGTTASVTITLNIVAMLG